MGRERDKRLFYNLLCTNKPREFNLSTSFSPLEKNFFDLPNKYGDIDYISDFGSDLFMAQNSKVGFPK